MEFIPLPYLPSEICLFLYVGPAMRIYINQSPSQNTRLSKQTAEDNIEAPQQQNKTYYLFLSKNHIHFREWASGD